ncbi:hypothetical protein Pmani_031588, partial [Petrolisthes manimaculis]
GEWTEEGVQRAEKQKDVYINIDLLPDVSTTTDNGSTTSIITIIYVLVTSVLDLK